MSAEQLAAFVAGLPEGKRHGGFFWAARTAAEDGLSKSEAAPLVAAAEANGLDRDYAERTLHEAFLRE